MANTYTQIHIHAVFTVQNRNCIIQNTWKDELFKYINNQEVHHQKITFIEEYQAFQKAFEIEYNTEYIFKPVEI